MAQCARAAQTNGMCKNHAEKARRAALPFKVCIEGDCEKDSRYGVAGRCGMHAKRFKVHGDANTTIRVAGGRPLRPCATKDCQSTENINWAPHCAMHGSRLRRHGDAGDPGRLARDWGAEVGTVLAASESDECVEFENLNTEGYGLHRRAYETATGRRLRPEMQLDHMCRNRACANLTHLEVVTRSENSKRMWAARDYLKDNPEPGPAFWLEFFRNHWPR